MMTLTYSLKEALLDAQGDTVVCWKPLEIVTANGEMLTGLTAEVALTDAVSRYFENMKDIMHNTKPVDPELEDVREFHVKFDILNSASTPTMLATRKLNERIECMQEELDEFRKAVDENDFAEQADALIDLVYFAKGTAVMMGLPWKDLWDDVHRANMEKVRGVGKRGHNVDMVKPIGWKKPDGAAILAANGFNQEEYCTAGWYDESKCLDDPAVKQSAASAERY